MANAGSATGDNIQTREKDTLGYYRSRGLMMYKDPNAYYCTDCELIYNVKCAICSAKSRFSAHLPLNQRKDDIFLVERPLVTIKAYGIYWTPAMCRKCDFVFRVIIQ